MNRSRDPDVTHVGFGATDGPNALVRRHRNPGWLVVCFVLAVGGLAGTAVAIAGFSGTDVDGEAIASGRIAALGGPRSPAQRFSAPARQDYTVWLKTDGVANSLNRDKIAAATNCVVAFENGGSARFRGARQGASVTLGDRSTVGVFTAPAGLVAVACHQEPWGRRRGYRVLRKERSFLVVPGRPPGGWLEWILLFGGVAALALAVPAGGRWRQGLLRRR